MKWGTLSLNSSSPVKPRKRSKGGKPRKELSSWLDTSTTRSPLRMRARSSEISTQNWAGPGSVRALPGVSVMQGPSVERTRTLLSPHASTWRVSRLSRTVNPDVSRLKVAIRFAFS